MNASLVPETSAWIGAPASISIWTWLLSSAAMPTGAVMSWSSRVRPFLAKRPWSIPTHRLPILGLPPTVATIILLVPGAADTAAAALALPAGLALAAVLPAGLAPAAVLPAGLALAAVLPAGLALAAVLPAGLALAAVL